MQVRIGIRDVSRENAFESTQSPDAVRAAVSEAVGSGAPVIELEDEKGGKILVPTSALGYVEIGAQEKARVGFGTH